MTVRSINSNIKSELIEILENAKSSIFVAVAWFTDQELFKIICSKAASFIDVQIIIHDDYGDVNSINFSRTGLDFSMLHFCGGEIFLVKGHHNKYCVIDETLYISGSYNWTYGASLKEDGFEKIEVYSNSVLALDNIANFKKLKSKGSKLIDKPSNLRIPKIDISKLKVIKIRPLNNQLLQIAMMCNKPYFPITVLMSTIYLKIPEFNLTESCDFFVQDDKGQLQLSKKVSIILFQDLLWLVPKNKI